MDAAKQKILEHYKNPLNSTPIDRVTHFGEAKNLSCGDEVYFKIEIRNSEIQNTQSKSEGCSICVASGSILSEEIKGKSLDEVEKITEEIVLENIGIELNEVRKQCALLSFYALKDALKNKL